MSEMNQAEVEEFKRKRQQLQMILMQKQQSEAQLKSLEATLKELTESKQDTVYKAIGNILIQKKAADVKKELTDTQDSVSLRLKTLVKQEDSLVARLNKLKDEIEGTSKSKASEDDEDE